MNNEVLRRSFWIETSAEKLLELTADFQRDDRVKDFDKIAEGPDLGKTDTKKLVTLLEWVTVYIADHSELTDSRTQDKKRQIRQIITKLKRKIQ